MKICFRSVAIIVLGIGLVSCGKKAPPEEPVAGNEAVSVAVTEAPVNLEAPPVIKFESDTCDFGPTSLVQKVNGTFLFTNAGASDLKVGKLEVFCGCTIAALKPENGILKPGEKGELTFSLDVSRRLGQLSKDIVVPSNDPKNPKVPLKIKINILQTIDFHPVAINFGRIRQDKATNAVVRVKRVDGKKLVIRRAESTIESIDVKVEPVDDAEGNKAVLLIKVAADSQPGTFSGSVFVFVDDSKQPSVTIPVNGQVQGEVSVTPERLFWVITDPKNFPGEDPPLMTTRKILIEATAPDKPLEIKNAMSTIKGLSLEVVTKVPGTKFELVAKLSAPPKESESGVITFETNATTQPTVTVPVTINVPAR